MKKNTLCLLSAVFISTNMLVSTGWSPVFAEETEPVQDTAADQAAAASEDGQADSITATFYPGNGGSFANVSGTHVVIHEDVFTLTPEEIPTVVAKPGYTFIGWSVDGGNPVVNSVLVRMVLTGTHTITAVYKRASFTVTFEGGEHGVIEGQDVKTVPVDDPVGDAPAVKAEAGYTFIGWKYGETTYTPEEAASLIVPAENITLTAVYAPVTLTITVNAGEHGTFEEGQKETTLSDIPYGESLEKIDLPVPTAEKGYKFSGWDLDLSNPVTENLTVTALWEKVTEPEKPETPETPEKPAEPEKPAKPEKPAEKPAKPATPSKTPHTAAFAAVLPLVGASLASLSGVILLKRRQK